MATVAAPRAEGSGTVVGPAERSQVLHIPSLDGLRAVSFFIVFVAHAGVEQFPGGLGVTIFFFLSGFLITTLMRVEAATTGTVSLKNFYLRRALRILPPFYIVLFLATVVGLSIYPDLKPPIATMPVASQALHFSNYWIALHGWGGTAPGTGVFWSLAVEEHFYLLFPFVFLALERRGLSGEHKARVFWGVCAVVLLWRCVLVLALGSSTDRTYLCSDTRIDSIAFGCALAVWNNPVLDVGGKERADGGSAILVRFGFPAGVVLLLVTLLFRNPTFRETIRYSLQGIALTPIFMAAVRRPDLGIFRALNWRPMRFLGTLSYVLYLTHHAVLYAVSQVTHLTGIFRAMTALALALGMAWLMNRYVERPSAKLRRKLSTVA